MPPPDLETLVSACAGVSSDKKIACETLANTANTDGNNHNQEQHHDGEDDDHDHQPEIPPDFPSESFWLSKDAEFDWFDRHVFFERKDSQKGNSHSHPHAGGLNPTPSSISQRFSSAALKVKASIIGLPKPQQKFDGMFKRNCKPSTTANWFPKRTSSVGESDAPFCEPSSPKVSCIGRIRVRSKRDRWRLKKRQSSVSETGSLRSKPDRKQKAGLFSMILRSKKGSEGKTRKESSGRKSVVININRTPDIKEERLPDALPARVEHSQRRKSVGSEPRRCVDSTGGEPPGFGGLNRFTSFRRSDSWVGDAQVEQSPTRKSVGNEPRRSVDSSGGEPSGFGGLNRFTSFRRSDSRVSDALVEYSPPRKSVGSEPRRSVDRSGGEPSGFGGLNRFTSFRRSDSWVSDVA